MTTFREFFRAATAGHDPYPHQRCLEGEHPLPQLLNVPPGAARWPPYSRAGCGEDGSRPPRSAARPRGGEFCMVSPEFRVEGMPWDEPGGSLLTGQVVSGVKGT